MFTHSTIVIVGMMMFKVKELVKVRDKSEIWSEDIKTIRKRFDAYRKNHKAGETRTQYNTEKIIPMDTVKN